MDTTIKNNTKKVALAIPQFETSGFSNRPLSVKLAGRFEKVKDHIIEDRVLDEYVLIYCISGKGWGKINGVKTNVSKGNIIFCPKGIAHSYGSDIENPWSILWFHFTGESGEYFYSQTGTNKTNGVIDSVYQKSLHEQLEKAVQILTHIRNFTDVLQAESILTQALCEVTLNLKCTEKDNDLQQIYVNKTINFLEQNYLKGISLDEISNNIGLSKFYLIRLFKEYTGSTPKEYAKSLKLNEGCKLLLETDLSISQISSKLGFSNQYHFSQSFKEFSGYSPSKFRRLVI